MIINKWDEMETKSNNEIKKKDNRERRIRTSDPGLSASDIVI